jgi:hypothetical protein
VVGPTKTTKNLSYDSRRRCTSNSVRQKRAGMYRRFGGPCYTYLHGGESASCNLEMETYGCSKTLVPSYQTVRRLPSLSYTGGGGTKERLKCRDHSDANIYIPSGLA